MAAAHGFQAARAPAHRPYDYADIDDDFISIHHWLKWPKFGFTRVWDNLSLEIRNGRLTRDEAIADRARAAATRRRTRTSTAFCAYVGISEERFFAIAETFRDPGDLDAARRRPGGSTDFLVPDYAWS